MNRLAAPLCAMVLTLAAASAPLAAQPSGAGPAARDSLRLADQRASEAVYAEGLRALPALMLDDAVILLEGAPLTRGRAAAQRLLDAQPALRDIRLSWEPFRVLLSRDGSLGATFGGTIVQGKSGPPNPGRYITVWRRGDAGAWRVVAHVQAGLLAPKDLVLPAGAAAAPAWGRLDPTPFSEADLAFARMAADSGAPAAFQHFVAPDGMILAPTGELSIGPAAVRARLGEGRGATADWRWAPLIALVAPSGDLGATIGEAEIRLRDVQPNPTSYSKYLTVWQRQQDGSLKFVIDGGNSRPPR